MGHDFIYVYVTKNQNVDILHPQIFCVIPVDPLGDFHVGQSNEESASPSA